jgi:DsbC/DsbD-like thiol-disulfide interchange protein
MLAKALCAAFFLLGAAVQARAQAAPEDLQASPWTQVHSARIRLIAGPTAMPAGRPILAALQVDLADGWKTYWRMPGDAGVPPEFVWNGSTNVAAVNVLYPAPKRLSEPAGDTVGYKHQAIFPIEIRPTDASKPVIVKLALALGVCREICIPVEANTSLTLVPGKAGRLPEVIATALERVPRQNSARRPNDPELARTTAVLDGASPKLRIDARFPAGASGADIFIEAPDGIFVPLPKRMSESASGDVVRFEADLSRGGNAQELRGKTLTLTMVSDAGASTAQWTLP